MANAGKIVIVAALDGTFMRQGNPIKLNLFERFVLVAINLNYN
jgi:hypothetical protein